MPNTPLLQSKPIYDVAELPTVVRPLIIDTYARQQLDIALATIPPAHKGAILMAITTEGAKFALGYKVADQWKVAAFAEQPWKGKLKAGVEVVYSWGS